MLPTLRDGQWVLAMPGILHRNRLRRGDVVVLVRPSHPFDLLIKRIVGMPNESIALDEGRLYADDVPLFAEPVLPGPDGRQDGRWWNGPDDYFVLGDNPARSTDSRSFGYVSAERIIGRVWVRVWPPVAIGLVS